MNKNIGFLLLVLCSATALNAMDSDFLPTALESATVPQDYSKLKTWVANHPKVTTGIGALTGAGLALATRNSRLARNAQFLITSLPMGSLGAAASFAATDFALGLTNNLLRGRLIFPLKTWIFDTIGNWIYNTTGNYRLSMVLGACMGFKAARKISLSSNPYVVALGGAIAGASLAKAAKAKLANFE